MEYKRTFRCGLLKIEVFTNSRDILKIIESLLDLPRNHPSRPSIQVSFRINRAGQKDAAWLGAISRRKIAGQYGKASVSFRDKVSTVAVDVKTGEVKADIYYCVDDLKSFIWFYVFMEPLRAILASRGFFYMHAAIVQKNRDCVIIAGPSCCGKTTLSLILAKKGYNILSDDDCFIKHAGEKVLFLPFSRKAGLNKYNIKRHPHLERYAVGSLRRYVKKRVALSAVFGRSKSAMPAPGRIMVVLPQFKKNAGVRFKPLPVEKALGRIDKGPRCIYSGQRDREIFWKFYDFMRKCRSFSLTYDNRTVFKAAGLIHARLDTPRP